MTTTVVTNPTTPLLTDLPSMTDARLWGEALARDMNLYRSGRLAWEHLSPSCILYGPPGTGKTMFAEALAATCGIPLVAASLPAYRDPRDVMADGTLDGLAKTFALALKHAPSICFIDRIDFLRRLQAASRLGLAIATCLGLPLHELLLSSK